MSDITALRSHLFDAIQGVKSGTMEVAQAKVIADLGHVIIDTAKVEVDYLKLTGSKEATNFIPALAGPSTTTTPTGEKTIDGNVTTHKIK